MKSKKTEGAPFIGGHWDGKVFAVDVTEMRDFDFHDPAEPSMRARYRWARYLKGGVVKVMFVHEDIQDEDVESHLRRLNLI